MHTVNKLDGQDSVPGKGKGTVFLSRTRYFLRLTGFISQVLWDFLTLSETARLIKNKQTYITVLRMRGAIYHSYSTNILCVIKNRNMSPLLWSSKVEVWISIGYIFVHIFRHAKNWYWTIRDSQPTFLILRIKILQVTVLREFNIIKSLANAEDVLLLLSWKLLRWYKFNLLAPEFYI